MNHRFVSISCCLLFIIASAIWFGDSTVATSFTPNTSLTLISHSEEEYRLGVFPPGNPVDQLQSAINLGITQPRVILSWNLFEPSKGQYKFMLYDWNIYKMHQAGMPPIVTVKCDSSHSIPLTNTPIIITEW